MVNELSAETSPYLLQHAENPVAWHAWNERSLATARASSKPILLSIGYSACHWCHVMAHESFEDAPTAALMNELFVNIKVDREERPDLDKIYQLLHQLTTSRPGGWPLTVFLTPDTHLPIFIGTYFPREPRHGMPAFGEVLRRVAAYYEEHRDEVQAHGRALTAALSELDAAPRELTQALDTKPLTQARAELAQGFDAEYGGFGQAPKFPHPTQLEYLLAYWRSTSTTPQPDLEALRMAALSLKAMAEGGLYDQLGGGFFRYSVDRYWLIPHFEKMLYDNAAMLALYSEAHGATGEPLFAAVASETADWLVRDMQHEAGGFFSTLDADSQGEEGKFYVWTPEEAAAPLEPEEYALAAPYLGLDGPANFEGRAWHLRVATSLEAAAEQARVGDDSAAMLLARARKKLLTARRQRVPPARDEKILTAWNALAIRGFAVAARHLDRSDLIAPAERAVEFIRHHLWREGRLFATYKDGRARFPAYLDDYAFLADALLELLQCRWNADDLELARALAAVLLEQFEDPRGGFFFTAREHESLVYRPKPFADDALPAGNAVATRVLLRLGHLLGEVTLLEAAERALENAAPLLSRYPQAHCSMLQSLQAYLEPPEIIVLRGAQPELSAWSRYLNAGYHPQRIAFPIPVDTPALPGFLAELPPQQGTVAYVCRGTHCEAPATSLEALIARLGAA